MLEYSNSCRFAPAVAQPHLLRSVLVQGPNSKATSLEAVLEPDTVLYRDGNVREDPGGRLGFLGVLLGLRKTLSVELLRSRVDPTLSTPAD